MSRNGNNLTNLKRVLGRATTPSMRRGLFALRDYALNAYIAQRRMSGWNGMLPGFIIIGAQKGGTTYLYDELARHPCILPALAKEVHFFDANFRKGLIWYRAFFPRCSPRDNERSEGFITGEASPSYLFHPHAARRLKEIVPEARLIVMLRNPVGRAYSHYYHEVRLGFETQPFEYAIEKENERLHGEKEKILADESYDSYNYMHYSYLSRGIYADQLQAWRTVFPEEQIWVINSEDFFKDTPRIIKQVIEFLDLPDWNWEEQRGKPKTFPYPKMDADTRKYLLDYFKPHNQRLYELLGRDFGWDK